MDMDIIITVIITTMDDTYQQPGPWHLVSVAVQTGLIKLVMNHLSFDSELIVIKPYGRVKY